MKTKIVCIYLCMLLMIPVLSTTVTANSPPTAPDIDGPTSGKAGVPQTYTFTSTDPDGSIVSWTWDFGDGFISTLKDPTHDYSEKGSYTVTLTVSDNDGNTETLSNQIKLAIGENGFEFIRGGGGGKVKVFGL